MRDERPTKDWFQERVTYEALSGCWIWMGAVTTNPRFAQYQYGNVCINRRWFRASRLAYQIYVGDIPEGMVLDHLCRNTWCVNPDHLEAVTQAVNIMRGLGASAKNAVKTHCKRGHEFSSANTKILPSGARQCRACWRMDYYRRRYPPSDPRHRSEGSSRRCTH